MSEQLEINWTERDFNCAQAVLARGVDAEILLPTLTDEAIVALDGINREQLTALPWLDQYPEQKELVCNVALRSLLTSGAAFPLILGDDFRPSGLAANEDITGVMALRRTGERIITAELQKDGGPVWLYGYVHGSLVLEELVDGAGSHTFMLSSLADFAGHVMELANASAVSSADGASTSFALEEFEAQAGTVLDGTLGVTSMTGISTEESAFANYTLYATADQLIALTSRKVGEAVFLDLTPVSAATALASVGELVRKGLA